MPANLVTLNEVIDGIDFIDNSMAYGHHLSKPKKRFLGLNGIRELNLDVARSIKGKKIALRANNTIELPDDYMDYVGIFVLGANNQMIPLGYNRYINISNEPILDHNNIPILDHNGDMIYSDRAGTNLSTSTNIFRQDDAHYPMRSYNGNYGIGGGKNAYGYYRVDYEGNTIQFDTSSDVEYIYLEYISNGLTNVNSENIVVPVQVVEALRAFIMWQSVIYQRGVSSVEKRQLQSHFYNEKRKATARMSKMIAEESRQSSRVWTTQTVRF